MDKEQSIINIILNTLPKSEYHLNEFFESDAEILWIGNQNYLFSTDEFSKEDLFLDFDPFTLGRNLVIGTITDIFASGGEPLMYGHCLAFEPDRWNEKYLRKFSEGISSVLEELGVGFIGGDISQASSWRYTGIVIGKSITNLSRKGCSVGDSIFITGDIGRGNLEAAFSLYSKNLLLRPLIKKSSLKLHVPMKKAALIRKYANTCIDSSDGVFTSVEIIADLNNVGYQLRNLIFCPMGKKVCKLLDKPEILLFLGECGEYELVFTVSAEKEPLFLKEAAEKNIMFYKIGEITNADTRDLYYKEKIIDLKKIAIRARDFENASTYLEQLTVLLKDNYQL